MAIVVDPSRLPPIGTHRTRCVVGVQAKPYQVSLTVALHNGHHRLPEGRHGLKALFPATALVEGLNLRHRLGHTGAEGRLGRLRLPHRSHHQASLRPALSLALALLAHRHGILIALGDHLRLTLWAFSIDRAEDMCPMANRFTVPVKPALLRLPMRQGARANIT